MAKIDFSQKDTWHPPHNRDDTIELWDDFLTHDTQSALDLFGRNMFRCGQNSALIGDGQGGIVSLGGPVGTFFHTGSGYFDNRVAGRRMEVYWYANLDTQSLDSADFGWVGAALRNDNGLVAVANSDHVNFRYISFAGGVLRLDQDSGVPWDANFHEFYIRVENDRIVYRIDGANEYVLDTNPGVDFEQTNRWRGAAGHNNADSLSQVDYIYVRCSGITRL